jgi:hypothetical protein
MWPRVLLALLCVSCQLTPSEGAPDHGEPCVDLGLDVCNVESGRCRLFDRGKDGWYCVETAKADCATCPGECVSNNTAGYVDDAIHMRSVPACAEAVEEALAARAAREQRK